MESKKCCENASKTSIKMKFQGIKVKTAEGHSSSKRMLKQNLCNCGSNDQSSFTPITQYDKSQKWIIGEISTPEGLVPRISTELKAADLWGTCKVRFGIGRMNYKISPGLYAVGTPDSTSPVLVTANYKLTFDALRSKLDGLDVWLMVLDTKGVNVWCAAGKGTFGTKELLKRISKARLSKIVTHKTLILPQLGATGVSAHQVTRLSGFKIVYGPIRAEDIKAFLNSGMKATEEMRKVKFRFVDRLVLTPIEFISTLKVAIIAFGFMFLMNLIAFNPFGLTDFYALMGALITGAVITPILLPWIPVRAFSAKGLILGLIWAIVVNLLNISPAKADYGLLKAIAYMLILPAVASFYAMNFTGSSTYTSFSGVIKEMKIAIPAIAISIGTGVVLLLVNCFMQF